MLRVTTLYASSASATAAYYTQYLTQAVGEQPGVWSGVQASRLGLAGEVGAQALQAVLEGRDPVTGTPLGQPLVERYRTDGSIVRAVAGFDATFSGAEVRECVVGPHRGPGCAGGARRGRRGGARAFGAVRGDDACAGERRPSASGHERLDHGHVPPVHVTGR